MSIYSNGAEVQLELPDHAPGVSLPLVQPVTAQWPGTRLYALNGDINSPHAVRVTERGHWYHLSDPGDGVWTCRGCGSTGATGPRLDDNGKCKNPPSAQDIATTLLERFARPAPAEMHAQQRRIRFIRTAVAA